MRSVKNRAEMKVIVVQPSSKKQYQIKAISLMDMRSRNYIASKTKSHRLPPPPQPQPPPLSHPPNFPLRVAKYYVLLQT